MDKIIKEANKILTRKKLVLIAVDGPCASGKTTLAQNLSAEIGAQIICTDDFFLPFDLKTPERMEEIGGNIHYERFIHEISNVIKNEKPFEYGVYRCSEGCITEKKTVIPEGIIIIEGSYSMNPKLMIDYDLRVFVEASFDVRLERILKRDGAKKSEIFKSKWIPMENRYFEFFDLKNRCDIIIEK